MNDSDRLKQTPIGDNFYGEAVNFLREIAIQLALLNERAEGIDNELSELNRKLTPNNIFNAITEIQLKVEST